MSMSTFNLDRFRYDKKSTTTSDKEQSCFSRSPDSEKENKPGNEQMLKLAAAVARCGGKEHAVILF